MDGTQGISWVIDGIVLQHAGELLFDTAATSTARTLGRSIYSACLEDFAFAIVYGKSFITPGALIQVGGEIPGEILADRFHFMRRKPSVEGVSFSPDDLLRTPIYRERIISDLLHLDKALTIGKEHWEHWIVREARVYLGNHSSLFDRDCKAEELQFGKFPPYACDKALQAKIPRKLVDHLVGCLSHVCQGYSRAVLEEFVQRCVLTLDVISWWYDAQSTKISSGIRLPFSVRSMIKQSAVIVGKVVPKRRVARRLLVRHALADIFSPNQCNTRDEVIECLIAIRDLPPYTTIRKHWLDLENELESGNDKGIDQLIYDIRNCAVRGDLLPVGVQCDRETLDDQHRTTIRRALRNLAPYKEQEYQERMDRIFPELALAPRDGRSLYISIPSGQAVNRAAVPNMDEVPPQIGQQLNAEVADGGANGFDATLKSDVAIGSETDAWRFGLTQTINNNPLPELGGSFPSKETIVGWFKSKGYDDSHLLYMKVFWCIGWYDQAALRGGDYALGHAKLQERLDQLKNTRGLMRLSFGITFQRDSINKLEDYFNTFPFINEAWDKSDSSKVFRKIGEDDKDNKRDPKWTRRAWNAWLFVDILLEEIGMRPKLTAEDKRPPKRKN